MYVAKWENQIIAQAEESDIVPLEGNIYFPAESVNMEFLTENKETYQCPWKGMAKYFDVKVGDKVNESAAWIYKEPSEAAHMIKGMIAFWNGVEVSEG